MTIHVFNPRSLLRQGSSAMLRAAAAGETVIIRAGSLVKDGRPVIKSEHGNSTAAYGAEAAGKVFKLVEVTETDIEILQQVLDSQTKTAQ